MQFFASGLNIPYDDLKDWKLLGKGRTAKVFRVGVLLLFFSPLLIIFQAQLYGSFVAVKIPRYQVSSQKENANYFQEVFVLFLKEGIMLKYEERKKRSDIFPPQGRFNMRMSVDSLECALGQWKEVSLRSCW